MATAPPPPFGGGVWVLWAPPERKRHRRKRKRKKGAGGAGKARIRRGGKGQRHGNLLEHANTLTQLLDKAFDPCPACSLNARRQKLNDVFAAWNVVTHGTELPISFLFCSNLSPIPRQDKGRRSLVL